MISEPGTPTLDQLKVFITVVDVGSFAGAARKLNRATSVISYSIGNLEAQLGMPLFDRESTRRPQLTLAGKAMLAEARTVISGIDGMRSKAKGLLQGLEGEIHVVLDVMLPADRVADALSAFREEFPTVALHLHMETLGAVTELVQNRRAVIGISGPLDQAGSGIEKIACGSVPMIPVAAPQHPLSVAGKNQPGAGRDHIQLVLTDRSQLTDGRDFAVVSSRTWRLADLGSKYILLKAGIGWGNMPVPMIAEDIAAGRLVHLDMPDARGGDYGFDIVFRTDTPPGPAARWLLERFESQSIGTDGALAATASPLIASLADPNG